MNTCIAPDGIYDNAREAGAHLRGDEWEKIQFTLTKAVRKNAFPPRNPPLTVCGIALCSFSVDSKYKSVTNSLLQIQ